MGYCGCRTLEDLRTKTRFLRISAAGMRESHAHDVIITKEAPNYRLECRRVRCSRRPQAGGGTPRGAGVLVLDFGSQYTQLIARRVREQHVYCEIHPQRLRAESRPDPQGIILSGGPSVYAEGAPPLAPASWISASRLSASATG